jgi:hypothetical protein
MKNEVEVRMDGELSLARNSWERRGARRIGEGG